jgi:hypothetical protein
MTCNLGLISLVLPMSLCDSDGPASGQYGNLAFAMS